jgi:hypothetical protein
MTRICLFMHGLGDVSSRIMKRDRDLAQKTRAPRCGARLPACGGRSAAHGVSTINAAIPTIWEGPVGARVGAATTGDRNAVAHLPSLLLIGLLFRIPSQFERERLGFVVSLHVFLHVHGVMGRIDVVNDGSFEAAVFRDDGAGTSSRASQHQ